MITRFGKRFLTNYIAGNVDFANKDIAIGIGKTTPDSKGFDTRLEFEFYRVPCSLGSIDVKQTGVDGQGVPIFSYTAIMLATIPQDVSGVITEMALYPNTRKSINNYDSQFITSFENNLNWTDGTYNPAIKANSVSPVFMSMIGENMVQIDLDASQTKEYTNSLAYYDLSGYSINDSLAIAYKLADNNVENIRVKFYSSDTAYAYMDFTPPTLGTSPDKIQDLPLSNLVYTDPLPDMGAIIKVGIQVTAKSSGAATIYLDGVRINDEDTFDPNFGMISRSLVTTTTTISGASASSTINVGSYNNLFIGQYVTGTGIASGAYITALSGTSVTLSAPNTGAVSGNGIFYGISKPSGRPVEVEYKLSLGF